MAYIMATYDQAPAQSAVQYGEPAPALGATTELPKWVGVTLVVGAVAGIGYLIYKGLQQRASVYRTVAAKEGSRGVLRMQAGEAAIGLMSAGTSALLDRSRARRNGRKARPNGKKSRPDPSRELESNAIALFFVGGNERDGDPESIALRKGEVPLEAVERYLERRLGAGAKVSVHGDKLLCEAVGHDGERYSYTTPVKVESRRK